jgi:uncharacterized protein (DUF736 family)
MIIGKFERHENGLSGRIRTLTMELDALFLKRDKGADYVVRAGDFDIGAAWRKSGEWGDYLSVKLDAPELPGPINCTIKLQPVDGFYLLSWQRPRRNGGDDRNTGGGV